MLWFFDPATFLDSDYELLWFGSFDNLSVERNVVYLFIWSLEIGSYQTTDHKKILIHSILLGSLDLLHKLKHFTLAFVRVQKKRHYKRWRLKIWLKDEKVIIKIKIYQNPILVWIFRSYIIKKNMDTLFIRNKLAALKRAILLVIKFWMWFNLRNRTMYVLGVSRHIQHP